MMVTPIELRKRPISPASTTAPAGRVAIGNRAHSYALARITRAPASFDQGFEAELGRGRFSPQIPLCGTSDSCLPHLDVY